MCVCLGVVVGCGWLFVVLFCGLCLGSVLLCFDWFLLFFFVWGGIFVRFFVGCVVGLLFLGVLCGLIFLLGFWDGFCLVVVG